VEKHNIIHVLISDDDIHLSSGIQEILELAWEDRLHISLVSTYDDAIASIKTNPTLHLIISRYSIFNPYHHNFLTKVKESDTLSTIPIIGIARIPAAQKAAIQFGIQADNILLGGFDAEELLDIVHRMMKEAHNFILPDWRDND